MLALRFVVLTRGAPIERAYRTTQTGILTESQKPVEIHPYVLFDS